MQKKLSLLLILSILFSTLCACSNSENKLNSTEPSSLSTIPFVSGAYTEPITTATVTEDTSPSELFVSLTDAGNFSEGLAWVKYINPNAGYAETIGILNQDGLIITNDTLSSINEFGSDFSGGYSYYNNDDGSFIVINSNGEVTAQSPEDGTSYQIICGGDGVYYVFQKARGMEVNEDRYGFIDANGNWLLEPTVDCPITYERTGYHGAHVFSTLWGNKSLSVYNVDTGTFKKYYGGSIRLVDEDDQPFQFVDGLLLGYCDDSVFTIDLEGNINTLKEFKHNSWGEPVVYRNDGIFFYGTGGFNETSVINKGAFYDLKGNLVADFSKYTVITEDVPGFYQFYDGIAAVKIKGADGGHYVGFVDKTGAFTCEPIKVTGAYAYTGGYVYIGDFEGSRMIDNKGNVLDFKHHGIYYDGYAWDKDALVFWDLNGTPLSCYVMT